MSELLVLVDRLRDVFWDTGGMTVMTARDYITKAPDFGRQRVRVINLSQDYSYLGIGYYASLIGQARKHRLLPSVLTILDLSRLDQVRALTKPLEQSLVRATAKLDEKERGSFSLVIAFGKVGDRRFERLAREAFALFPCPLLRLSIRWFPDSGGGRFEISRVKAAPLELLKTDEDKAWFAGILSRFTRQRYRLAEGEGEARYNLAILHDPREKMPPSNAKAMRRFTRAAEATGFTVSFIRKKDFGRLPEFDALFIRETTAVDNHTYRFARRAKAEGMVVFDDPNSILLCANKVYLSELLSAHHIPTPKTLILDRKTIAKAEELGFPLVLKVPDGAFSLGVFKVENREELIEKAGKMLEHSDLILAQQFMYTDFDWRVGILGGKPLFVSRYEMAPKHWQIYNHSAKGNNAVGDARPVKVEEAPPQVVQIALKAAALIGDGLYGVDLKQVGKKVYVIEINDNPNIDAGYEDAGLGKSLYKAIMMEFRRRLDMA